MLPAVGRVVAFAAAALLSASLSAYTLHDDVTLWGPAHCSVCACPSTDAGRLDVAVSPPFAPPAGAAQPLAPMMSISVDKNSEVLFSLPGYSPDGSKVRALALSAPVCGGAFVRWSVPVPPLRRGSPCPLPAVLQLTTSITSLPEVGTLYQISQIFSDYGYQPQRGSAITAANATSPVVITGSRYRLVYVPPVNTNVPQGKVRAPAPAVACRHT